MAHAVCVSLSSCVCSLVQALNECRRLIADDAELDDLRDWTLVRFLRNNSFAVQPAIDQMKTYLVWNTRGEDVHEGE